MEGRNQEQGGEARAFLGTWRRERFVGSFLVLVFYGFYYPFTQWVSELPSMSVSIELDALIPLEPSWIWVYGMIYPAAFLPLFVIRDPLLFRRTLASYGAVTCVALMLFVLVPVHMVTRPDIAALPGDGFWVWGTRFCYWVDTPTCCFPSLHVAASSLAALCCYRVDRWVGVWSGIVAVGIALSTLLVKQHFVLDVVGGMALALGAYFLLLHKATPLRATEWAYSRSRVLYPIGLFGLFIGVLYGLYLGDWTPWATS